MRLHILGFVEASLTVINGKVELTAAWERFAGIVDRWRKEYMRLARGAGVVLDGEIRIVVDKLASLQLALDAGVDVLLLFRAKAIPKSHARLPPPFEFAERSQQCP